MAKGGEHFDPWNKFLQNGLPLINRFFQRIRFKAEASEHRVLLTTLVSEAADQG